MSSSIVSAAWHAGMTHGEGSDGLCVAYGPPVNTLCTHDLVLVPGLIEQAHALAHLGMYVLGAVSYEAAPAFDATLSVRAASNFPLAQFYAFQPEQLQLLPLNRLASLHANTDFLPWRDVQTHDEYMRAFEQTRQAIEAGEFYQINLTTRLVSQSTGVDAWLLFQHLYVAQPAPQSVFLRADGCNILSLSPELFFHWDGLNLQTEPMKGTRRADSARVDVLSDSEKDRAENVMIVDLLRNDMAKVCKPRSVQVRSLFDVMHLPTVDQMTSTICGQTLPGTRLVDVFSALYPCGSVTGAPKSQAMLRIAQWEPAERNLYCGALGILKPGGEAQFNVPIRTVLQYEDQLEYGVGSGVTWYSTAVEEKREWWQKTTFLRNATVDFELLETLRLDEGNWVNLEDHLARLATSANFFSYVFDLHQAQLTFAQLAQANPQGVFRARALLAANGEMSVELHPFEPSGAPVTLRLADQPMRAPREFIVNKTNYRPQYDAFQLQANEAFDVLLFSEQGFVTETCRGNVVVEINGELLTPQICEDTGTYLLPGVLRNRLLRENTIRPSKLKVEDVLSAQQVWLINSLRGWLPVDRIVDAGGVTLFAAKQ